MRTPKDWGQPCPNPEGVHYHRMRQGNVSAIATYLTHSGKRRLLRCHTWEAQFSETRATVFFALRTAEDKVMMARKMLLVRVPDGDLLCARGDRSDGIGLAQAGGAPGRSDQPTSAAGAACDPGATRRDVELHRAHARV